MYVPKAKVEELISNLFCKVWQRSEDDFYIDKLKEFIIKFSKFVYMLSLSNSFVRSLDECANGSRLGEDFKIYLEIDDKEHKVTFVISSGKSIEIKCFIFVSSDLLKEITTFSYIDKESPMEFTIIPGIEFTESSQAKDYVFKVYREHILQIASRFNIAKFQTNVSYEYQVVSLAVFTYAVRYITNNYRKVTNIKDTGIIDGFPRLITADEYSIRRDDCAIRIYGRDSIIGDHTDWYCKVGFIFGYPFNIYVNSFVNPLTNKTTNVSEYLTYLFDEFKQIVNKGSKREAYMNTIFNRVLASCMKNDKQEDIHEETSQELNEAIYFGHVTNIIKKVFKCSLVDNELKAGISVLDYPVVYSSIGSLLHEGFYSEMYCDINTNIQFLISIYRRTKSPTSPSAMIIVAMDMDNNIKFSKTIYFKAKVSATEGCQFVVSGNKNHCYVSSLNTIDQDKQYYLPTEIMIFRDFLENKTNFIGDFNSLVTYTHEKGKRDPIIVVQELSHTSNIKYLVTKCHYGDKYEVVGVFDKKL